MRDGRVDEAYFEKRRAGLLESISGFGDWIAGGDPKLVAKGSKLQWQKRFELIVADYSMGVPLDELKADVIASLRGLVVYEVPPVLPMRKWLVSMASMLGVDDVEMSFARSLPKMKNDGIEAFLAMLAAAPGEFDDAVDTFVGLREELVASRPTKYFDRYVDAIEWTRAGRHEEAAERLCTFVRRDWYKTSAGAYWHNTHKQFSYVGYWCFEAAAVAQKFGIDDSALEGNKYYPYDMAHYLDDKT